VAPRGIENVEKDPCDSGLLDGRFAVSGVFWRAAPSIDSAALTDDRGLDRLTAWERRVSA